MVFNIPVKGQKLGNRKEIVAQELLGYKNAAEKAHAQGNNIVQHIYNVGSRSKAADDQRNGNRQRHNQKVVDNAELTCRGKQLCTINDSGSQDK